MEMPQISGLFVRLFIIQSKAQEACRLNDLPVSYFILSLNSMRGDRVSIKISHALQYTNAGCMRLAIGFICCG